MWVCSVGAYMPIYLNNSKKKGKVMKKIMIMLLILLAVACEKQSDNVEAPVEETINEGE